MASVVVEQATLEAADGHRFDVVLHGAATSDQPLLMFLPALGTPGRVYARFAESMASHGVPLCTFDWRGMASSNWRAARRRDFGYRHLVELDAEAVIAFMRRRRPQAALWVGGHSLGGQLAALVAATHADIRGLVTIASGTVFLPCYPPALRAQIRLLGMVAEIAGAAVGHFPGKHLGFGGREARGVMRDWRHVAHTGRYELRDSTVDYEKRLATTRCPVLALNFTADTWAPETAAGYLLAKMPNSHSRQWIWDAAQTGNQALDHFSWARHPELVAPRMARWMLDQAASTRSM